MLTIGKLRAIVYWPGVYSIQKTIDSIKSCQMCETYNKSHANKISRITKVKISHYIKSTVEIDLLNLPGCFILYSLTIAVVTLKS